MHYTHHTVMLKEAVDALVHQSNGHYIDATFGRGGHSRDILNRLSNQGRLTVFDKDPEAIATAQAIKDERLDIVHADFSAIQTLEPNTYDGILMDLGISSPQIDDPTRGFSFRHDGPLDMRMNPTQGISAQDWLATASETEITEVIHEYGEERFARAIAKAIIARRQAGTPLTSTLELAQLVANTVKTREPGQNPATRTFQAIRIFINAELAQLEQALTASLNLLRQDGRLVVISFHSLEDRIVKQFMNLHGKYSYDRSNPFSAPAQLALTLLGRFKPSAQEIAINKRSRSAVMRVAKRQLP